MDSGLVLFLTTLYITWFVQHTVINADALENNGTYLSDQIMRYVLADYHKEIRPYSHPPSPVELKFDLSLRQIIELDEPKQTLSINVWIRMYWSDIRLTWNSSDFAGIKKIILPSTLIWTPDLTLYDNAVKTTSSMSSYRVSVTSTGDVKLQFPEHLTSLCLIDTTYFPFDAQTCNLTFGSWAYNGFDVDIHSMSDGVKMENYKENVEWSILNFSSRRVSPLYAGVPYPSLIYTLHMRRKPLFYIINLIFPSVLMSCIAAAGFVLPVESGEKVSLQVMIILSLSVFQLIILDLMPPSSETFPLISAYFAASIVLVGLSSFMSVISLNIFYRGHKGQMTTLFLNKLCLSWIGRLLCVHRPSHTKKNSSPTELQLVAFKQKSHHAARNKSGETPATLDPVLKCCENISVALKNILNYLNQTTEEQHVKDDWKWIATTLDRLFLLIFFIIALVLCFVFTIKFSLQ